MILHHMRAGTGWWNKKQAVCSSNVKLISDADILMNIYVALGHREERCSQNQIWHWHVDNFKLTKPNWCYSKHFDTTSLEWNVSDVNGVIFCCLRTSEYILLEFEFLWADMTEVNLCGAYLRTRNLRHLKQPPPAILAFTFFLLSKLFSRFWSQSTEFECVKLLPPFPRLLLLAHIWKSKWILEQKNSQ